MKGRKSESKPTTKLKSNKLGFSENKENRKEALNLPDRVTQQRKNLGWKWMRKGAATKQVKPEKINELVLQGWNLA